MEHADERSYRRHSNESVIMVYQLLESFTNRALIEEEAKKALEQKASEEREAERLASEEASRRSAEEEARKRKANFTQKLRTDFANTRHGRELVAKTREETRAERRQIAGEIYAIAAALRNASELHYRTAAVQEELVESFANAFSRLPASGPEREAFEASKQRAGGGRIWEFFPYEFCLAATILEELASKLNK